MLVRGKAGRKAKLSGTTESIFRLMFRKEYGAFFFSLVSALHTHDCSPGMMPAALPTMHHRLPGMAVKAESPSQNSIRRNKL